MPDYTHWLNGSTESRDEEMFAGLYAELRKIARSRMAGERPEHTLEATALVHEAWMRLEKSNSVQWGDRKQFFGAASETMRRILVEAARRRLAAKRGGGKAAEPLDEHRVAAPAPDERILGIHEVLDQLEKEDAMEAAIVKLRFFSGMQNSEIAALLEMSERTVERHWKTAKVWLYRAMSDEDRI